MKYKILLYHRSLPSKVLGKNCNVNALLLLYLTLRYYVSICISFFDCFSFVVDLCGLSFCQV